MTTTSERPTRAPAPLPRHQHAFSDETFLAEFDLDVPELHALATAMAASKVPAAKAALVDHMRTRQSPRWLFDLRAVSEPSDTLLHLWPPRGIDNKEAILARADLVCENRFTITDGMVLDFGPELDWVTPQTCAHIVPGNAFKCCHWLRDLAFAWAMTRAPRYAAKWAELVERWRQDFPMLLDDDFTGREMVFNQHFAEKSMPTGQRLFNWLTCLYTGIPFAPGLDVETAFQFIKALWYNGAVYQHFEASPFQQHNHHIMRTVNVPGAMALAFPETPRFAGLMALSRDRMAHHARKSFLPDGGYAERSSSYAQVTVNMFLAPLAIARLNDIQLADADTLERIHRAADFLASIMLPTGYLPPSGDGSATDRSANAASLALATLACDSDLAATVLHRTGLAQLLPAALRPAPGTTALPRHGHCPDWGIAVLRTGWGPDASALAMNIPNGENPNRSHAHDDALSCSLILRGRRIVAVPANELYLYVNDAEWGKTPHHTYLYSSLGKNVVLPCGRPRLDPAEDTVGWLTDTPAVASSLTETAKGAELRAQATVSDVEWERRVTLAGDAWTVRDQLTRTAAADPELPHVLQWHFHYGVDVALSTDGAIAVDGPVKVRLTVAADTPWEAELKRDTHWQKPNSGRAGQPAPWLLRVTFGASTANACITTCFTIFGLRGRS